MLLSGQLRESSKRTSGEAGEIIKEIKTIPPEYLK